MFKNKKALAKALMKGRKFKTPSGLILTFDEGSRNPFIIEGEGPIAVTMDSSWDKFNKVTEILKESCCCCCKCKH